MKMDNFEAIKNMDRAAMERFLDQVYLTGVNVGMYAASLSMGSDEQNSVLEETHFDKAWLCADAEPATLGTDAGSGDEYLLESLCEVVLRAAVDNDDQQMSL